MKANLKEGEKKKGFLLSISRKCNPKYIDQAPACRSVFKSYLAFVFMSLFAYFLGFFLICFILFISLSTHTFPGILLSKSGKWIILLSLDTYSIIMVVAI